MSARPYVICHMCTTLDGKIMSSRWGKLRGHETPTQLYETTAASFGVGAWMVGTQTMSELASKGKGKLPKANRKIARVDHVADANAKTFAIGTDTAAKIHLKSNDVGGDHIVLLITEKASNDYLAHAQTVGASYLFCGKNKVDLRVALGKLKKHFGIEKLMLEGGGTFNGAMLAAGLVDEVSQIVVPIIDGGKTITGVFDVPGANPKKAVARLKFKSHQILSGDTVWVRYEVI